VGDEGPDQNIKVYGNILYKPTLVTTLGCEGRCLCRGTMAKEERSDPGRFRGITGIATDAFENLYVSQNGWAMGHGNGHGLEVQSYNIFGTAELVFGRARVCFAGGCGSEVAYRRFSIHTTTFKVDLQQPCRSGSYLCCGYDETASSIRDDLRITNILSTAQIQYIDGKKFLLGSTQHGTSLENLSV
jgi:hypothetical protein